MYGNHDIYTNYRHPWVSDGFGFRMVSGNLHAVVTRTSHGCAPAWFSSLCNGLRMTLWSLERAQRHKPGLMHWQSQPHPASNFRKALPPFHFLIVPFSSTVPSSIPYFLMTLRSWSMSNSSVASLPANIMMDFFPPGCSPCNEWTFTMLASQFILELYQ